jgi:hypothetical protein
VVVAGAGVEVAALEFLERMLARNGAIRHSFSPTQTFADSSRGSH